MVGDREYDILGARHNGIESIAVTYGYGSAAELAHAQPKKQIESFADLAAVIPQFCSQPA